MSRLVRWVAVGVAAAALAGCGPDYDHTELTGIVALAGAECTRERIVVTHGTLLKVHVVSKNDSYDEMDNSVTSANKNVLEVAPVINPRDWTLIGVNPGQTEVEIKANGKTVLIIEAFVVPQ